MSCNKCDNKNIETQYIGDLPIDSLADLPEYLLAERDVEDELSSDVVRSLVRIPTKRIVPNGNLDNIFAATANNDDLAVGEAQVKAVSIANLGSSYAVVPASDEHPTMFIMVGRDDKVVYAQNCGVINILCGHDYILLAQYYRGEDGEPTTDSTSGEKLFIPISKTQLLVNM